MYIWDTNLEISSCSVYIFSSLELLWLTIDTRKMREKRNDALYHGFIFVASMIRKRWHGFMNIAILMNIVSLYSDWTNTPKLHGSLCSFYREICHAKIPASVAKVLPVNPIKWQTLISTSLLCGSSEWKINDAWVTSESLKHPTIYSFAWAVFYYKAIDTPRKVSL